MLCRANRLCKRGGVGYTVKLELLFAKIGGIEPHALVSTSSLSLRAATSRRLSDTSRGGIGQPRTRNPNRATTRWSVRLRTESTCMHGGSPRRTPSRCISLQLKLTTMFQWIARSGLLQGASQMAVQGDPRACVPSMSRCGFGASWRRKTLRGRGMRERGPIRSSSSSWSRWSGPMASSPARCFGA